MLSKRFEIQGVNPATGGIAVLTLLAPSAASAKLQAEAAGLLYVVVREQEAVPPATEDAESSRAGE